MLYTRRMSYAIETTRIEKGFNGRPVLQGVDLAVPTGSVLALLGPNGAGKTTMVKILATLIHADAGTARVAGFDLAADRHRVRRAISLTGQYVAVDELQTGAENLQMMGRLHGLDRATARRRAVALLDKFDLADAKDRRLSTYSGGMRRRLDLAASLIADPAVIFLDEPTTGLDLPSRQAMWNLVKELVDHGVTVFLTTQYLEEADQLADHIAVLDHGRIVAAGTADELKRRIGDHRLEVTATDQPAFTDLTCRTSNARRSDPRTLTISIPTDGTAAHVRALLDALDPHGDRIAHFEIHSATLDDVFLALTKPTPETAHV
jgi:ABC-2 type transport system ATP-binding protein